MSIIARNCAAPGFSTLLTNLLRTYRPQNESQLEPWMREYSHGSAHQVYAFRFPSSLTNRRFQDVVVDFYSLFSVLLFGVETKIIDNEGRMIILNPTVDYKLHQTDVGFVICSDYTEFIRALAEHYTHDEGFREGPYGRMSSIISAASDASHANLSILDFLRSGRRQRRSLQTAATMYTVKDIFSSTVTDKSDSKMPRVGNSSINAGTLPVSMANFFSSQLPTPPQISVHSKGSTRPPSVVSMDDIFAGYFTCPKQLLKDCILEVVDFEHHIIVTGSFKGLRNFLMPLRLVNVQHVIPVVLFNDQPPSREIWDSIAIFPDVYYMRVMTDFPPLLLLKCVGLLSIFYIMYCYFLGVPAEIRRVKTSWSCML